jgi:hypothetical protein
MIACDAPHCRRGIVSAGIGWGDPCPVCQGLGTLSLKRTATLLEIRENTLRAFLRPDHQPRARTCQRILDAAIKILHLEADGKQLRLHS